MTFKIIIALCAFLAGSASSYFYLQQTFIICPEKKEEAIPKNDPHKGSFTPSTSKSWRME